MTAISVESYDVVEGDPGTPFWLMLTLGILWILVSFLILDFSYSSIVAISVLMGVILLFAAASEFVMAFIAPGWKWLHIVLGVLFALVGIFAFVYPGETFGTLALIFGWYLMLKGTFDIVTSLMLHGEHLWWMGLIVGVLEIALAFWAIGYVGRSATLLVLWVGLGALFRGITTTAEAFHLRHMRREALR
jgi:uncharacterized membrane protein HdeD (DUF308 family)